MGVPREHLRRRPSPSRAPCVASSDVWEGLVPDSSEALTASLRALSSFLLGEETPREALMQIACMGEAALPGAAATGLTLLSDGRPHTDLLGSGPPARGAQQPVDPLGGQ